MLRPVQEFELPVSTPYYIKWFVLDSLMAGCNKLRAQATGDSSERETGGNTICQIEQLSGK